MVHVHVEAGLLTDREFDVTQFDALGRLTGEFCCETASRFTMKHPP